MIPICGIAGIYLRQPDQLAHVDISRLSRELLYAIDDRGGHACGYAATTFDGIVQEQKAACRALQFEKEMYDMPDGMRSVILHTRFATQGQPAFPENNHPVRSGNIRVVHNGHISNDDELFNETGALRFGRVDSEAIPAVIDTYGWENALVGLEKLKGGYAIAAVNSDRPDDLLLAKGETSPLVVAVRDNFIIWASTLAAICYAWKACIGTVPSTKHIDWLTAGDYLRVTDGVIERGTFNYHSYRSTWSYRPYSSSKDDDDSGTSCTVSYMNKPIRYERDGHTYEYDPVKFTERCVDDDTTDGWDDDPTESLFEYTTIGESGADGLACFECGVNSNCTLNKVSRDTYLCEDCLDFLTDVSAGEPWAEELDLRQTVQRAEGADDDDNTPRITVVSSLADSLIRCPDCFECFTEEDMIRDAGEMICLECKKVAQNYGLDNFGLSWRR